MKLERLAIVGVFAAILTSCMTAKQYTYFNDMVVNDSYPIRERPEIKPSGNVRRSSCSPGT